MVRDDNKSGTSDVEIAISKMDNVAEFGGLVIWGHESVIEPENIFVKGANEWVAFAENVSDLNPAIQRATL